MLDPIVAIRQEIILEPDRTATIDLVTGAAAARDTAEYLVERYQDRRLADRVFDLAWTHNQVVLQQFGISEAEAQEYERLAGSMIFANAMLRADASVILRNRRDQSGLWGYSISGDLPIVLLQIADLANVGLVRQLLRARAYWRLKGLVVDLVIWTEDQSGYRQQLHDEIMGLISAGVEANVIDRPGGIFVRPADNISQEDRLLLQSVARIIIVDSRGTLSEQLKRRRPPEVKIPLLPSAGTRAALARWQIRPRLAPTSSWPTASAGLHATAANTSLRSRLAGRRRPRGSTCSPTHTSARWCPKTAWATPGPRTRTSSA